MRGQQIIQSRGMLDSSIDLVTAWVLWANSIDIRDRVLWFCSIRSWGRIGITLEFVAGLTVLLEIMGIDRIRDFGNLMRSRYESLSVANFIARIRSFNEIIRHTYERHESLFLFCGYVIGAIPTMYAIEQKLNSLSAVNIFFVVIVAAVLLPFIVVILGTLGWVIITVIVMSVFGALFSCALAVGLLGYLIIYLLVAFVTFFSYILAMLSVHPVSWMLSNPSLERLTKTISFVLFVLGFHFTLLAS